MLPVGNRRSGPADREAGYTLLELIVVLAILVMVAGGVPALIGSFSPEAKLRAATDETYAVLVRLRAEARQQGRETSFEVNKDGRSYVVRPADTRIELDDDLVLQLVANDDKDSEIAALRFYPSGGSSGGDVLVRYDGRLRKLSVDWLTSAISKGQGS